MKKPTKFTVLLSKDENRRLDWLVKQVAGNSKTAVFRMSLRLLEWLIQHLDDGYELILRKDGKDTKIKIFV